MSSDDEQGAVGEELAKEQRNIANAKWLIDHDGKVLPVTNLYDSDGESTDSPVLTRSLVAYDADNQIGGKWLAIGNVEPGDVWSKVS